MLIPASSHTPSALDGVSVNSGDSFQHRVISWPSNLDFRKASHGRQSHMFVWFIYIWGEKASLEPLSEPEGSSLLIPPLHPCGPCGPFGQREQDTPFWAAKHLSAWSRTPCRLQLSMRNREIWPNRLKHLWELSSKYSRIPLSQMGMIFHFLAYGLHLVNDLIVCSFL